MRASVLEIRSFLSDVIGQGRIAEELSGPLRLMRRYCVRFLERVGTIEDPRGAGRHLFREPRWRMHDAVPVGDEAEVDGVQLRYWFGEALGELRSGVGMQVAIVAASFGLDVEDDLARVLPDPDSERER